MPRFSHDISGRIVALLILLSGIAVLFFVLTLALHLFEMPLPGLNLPVVKNAEPPAPAAIGMAVGMMFSKILLLIVMAVVGSKIATKGVNLYFGASSSHYVAHQSAPMIANDSETIRDDTKM